MSQLKRKRPWGMASFVGGIIGLSTGMSMVATIYGALLIYGGLDLVVEALRVDGRGYQDIVKWPAIFIGLPLGMCSGVWLWRWIVIRFGLLTPEQLKEWIGG